jgi:hypothetical protein
MRRAFTAAIAIGAAVLALSCTTAGQAGPAPEAAAASAAPAEQAVVRAAPAAAAPAAASAAADPFAGKTNLALGKTTRANNHIYEFTAPKATDGEILTYWEGAANAYPDEISVDLGGEKAVKAIRLKLNPKKIWQARKQTLEVLTSSDGATYAQAVAPQAYQWDPDSGNAVTISLDAKAAFVKLAFTANEGSTGAQIAELEIYGE